MGHIFSYLEPKDFSYPIHINEDIRGVFGEIFKTQKSGLSFLQLTLNYKGGHYHHTKLKKFFIVKGKAQYKFKNILTNEVHKIIASEIDNMVIETIQDGVMILQI